MKPILNWIKNILLLLLNYFYDFCCFVKYSSSQTNNTEEKVMGKLIFYYHSIEKGLINEEIRYKFGQRKIKRLLQLIDLWEKRNYDKNKSQFITACSVLIKYFDFHKESKIDINDIISEKVYDILKSYSKRDIGGVISFDAESYFKNKNSVFDEFSNSRHSVRHFNGKKIQVSKIEEVISIARNSPSVCNRQSVGVYLVNNEKLVQQILGVQSGMNATADTVKQILIVSAGLGAFVSPVERNQMFVDGGIFLQNLLYALHFHGIAACSLNWSKPFFYEYRVRKFLNISHKHRIIAVVAIGYPTENFKVPYSCRKDITEILYCIN